MVRNIKFDRQDSWYLPDRTDNSHDNDENLFELIEGKTEPIDEANMLFAQTIVIERDLDLQVIRRVRPSLYHYLGILGGLMVILWLLGLCMTRCLTLNAYEDHMV